MQFNSIYFLIFFLPLTLAAYYLAAKAGRKAADAVLIAASFLFYGLSNPWYPVMLAVDILLNWFLAKAVHGRNDLYIGRSVDGSGEPGGRKNIRNRKAVLVSGIILNAAFLAVFKYTNFFLSSLNAAFGTDWPLVHLILPLGISFITFSQISWLVDSYRGETADVTFPEYVIFSVFFPKLSEGPILTMKDFLPQLRKESRTVWNTEEMVIGIRMFVCGLFKKLIFADTLGVAVDTYFSLIEYRSNIDSLVMMLAYTFQIYFDFSGYSDMAIGASKMLGFDIPANFNSPYRACTVTDFWRRWHISLTSFLREYVYFPLGGSRKGKVRTYVNIMIVYLISGFWHGANWTFVLWGIFHGLAQVVERLLGRWYRKVWPGIRWVITFGFVSCMWVLFRCSSWAEFQRFRWHLLVDRMNFLSDDLAVCLRIPGLRYLLAFLHLPSGDAAVNAVSVVAFLGVCFVICLCLPNNQKRSYRNSGWTLAASALMYAVCILSLSSVSSFIYNDF